MPFTAEQAQSHLSTTEWKTVCNTFPPKVDQLSPAVAKKQAARIRRFLDKAEKEDSAEERMKVLKEALERVEAVLPEKSDNEKLQARREKEQAARARAKAARERLSGVRTKLQEKAEEEKATEEGKEEEDTPAEEQ